jgi:Lar family restriction alleviation protein
MLKPCPFCGGTEIHFQKNTIKNTGTDLDGTIFHYVQCFDCECRSGDCCDSDATNVFGYSGDDTGKQHATESWNERHSPEIIVPKRQCVDDICLGDRYEYDGMEYTVKAFHGSTRVFVEGRLDEDDYYALRDEHLLKRINDYAAKHIKLKSNTGT